MNAIERIYHAYLDEMQVITILIPYALDPIDINSFYLEEDDTEIPLTIVDKIYHPQFMKYICHSPVYIQIGQQYWVRDCFQRKTDLLIGAVTRTLLFDETFYYEGKLGILYEKDQTTFRLWAPTATIVKLQFADPGRLQYEEIGMKREDKGVWSVTVRKNLEGYRYMYNVCVNLEWKKAVDPYAVAVTANGEEGVIVDLSKTKIPKRTLPPLENAVDSIIYETHIRDLTIHRNSGVKQKGTYTGAAELDTTDMDGNLTCLSYIKDLGITHLELLPLHDFAGVDENGEREEYNWGYNPLHFNVPDGSYSINPHDPYKRIQELKSLIDTIHKLGLRVILDVVYNHVYIRESSSFERIVPGYYFRHDEHGMPSNGTGVGNDVASERKMVRKFIIDSVLFWLKEYDVDGFRFDLMGILDTETMKEIRKEVDRIDPSILIIGEGWDLNTPLPYEKKANMHNEHVLPRIGQFNDWFRDSIKGSTFNLYDKGYALGNEHYYEMALQTIAGSIGLTNKEQGLFTEPNQSVNYVESHDNHTLWDKLMVCFSNEEVETIQKYHRLATTLVFLSQGIPFLHSGQEFFRTKRGVGNSYQSSDEINQLDWNRKQEFLDNVQYIKGIINIRKQYPAFRLPSAELIRKHLTFLPMKKPIIGWCLKNICSSGKMGTILVIINPLKTEEVVPLPKGKWSLLADGNNFYGKPVKNFFDQKLVAKPISSYVFIHQDEENEHWKTG